ncbi:MAG: hypothetical protein HQL07_08765 [Nitrospirae bacterium]|nr:hypothetical protein [Magnetococcales bacterium]
MSVYFIIIAMTRFRFHYSFLAHVGPTALCLTGFLLSSGVAASADLLNPVVSPDSPYSASLAGDSGQDGLGDSPRKPLLPTDGSSGFTTASGFPWFRNIIQGYIVHHDRMVNGPYWSDRSSE